MNEHMKEWMKCARIRAIKTIAQTAVATIGTAAVMGAVDWRMVASAAVLAGVLSLLIYDCFPIFYSYIHIFHPFHFAAFVATSKDG